MPSTTEKNSTTSSTANSSTSPWKPQADALTTAFTDLMGAYDKTKGATAPTDYVAGFSPEQLASFRSMIGYGNNTTIPDNQAAASGTLTSAGTSGMTGALSGYAGFDPTASNNTASMVDAAKTYAAGQDIDSQVASAMQTAKQTARDVTLPGIEQRAAMSGNTNSSRTGIAEGLVERDLAQTAANMKGSLSSQAFQNGLSLAQTQAQSNNTAKLAALAGQGALSGNATSAGESMGNSSIDNMLKKLTASATGGAGLTAAEQAKLDNELQQFKSGTSAPYASLSNLIQLLQGNYGSTTSATSTGKGTETSSTTASPLSIAGGLLGAGTSLFGSGGFNILGSLGQGMLSGR